MMGGLDDGPELPKSAVMAWKKPLVIKAFQEGLSARACARVFDVSHETAACWTAGHQRKKDVPDKQPPKIEGLREALSIMDVKGPLGPEFEQTLADAHHDFELSFGETPQETLIKAARAQHAAQEG